jgi:hypothetical protein
MSDWQQFLFADTFLLDAGSHVTLGLATILVYQYIPIGCGLPRDLRINSFCCFQKSFLLDVISNNRYRLQIKSFPLGSTFVANCNIKL